MGMLPLLLSFALAAVPKAPSPGPTPRGVENLVKPMSMGADVSDYVSWSVKEMGQAVVVVEGEYALPMPKVTTGIRIFDGALSIFRPRLPLPTEIPMAPWMDTSTIMGSGGNVAGKIYPIGWGY